VNGVDQKCSVCEVDAAVGRDATYHRLDSAETSGCRAHVVPLDTRQQFHESTCELWVAFTELICKGVPPTLYSARNAVCFSSSSRFFAFLSAGRS
jgi:hypothetical protein